MRHMVSLVQAMHVPSTYQHGHTVNPQVGQGAPKRAATREPPRSGNVDTGSEDDREEQSDPEVQLPRRTPRVLPGVDSIESRNESVAEWERQRKHPFFQGKKPVRTRGEEDVERGVRKMARQENTTLREIMRQSEQLHFDDAGQSSSKKDFKEMIVFYRKELMSSYNFPEFITFDYDKEDDLAEKYPRSEDKATADLIKFAHALFRLFKTYGSDHAQLFNIAQFAKANRNDQTGTEFMKDLSKVMKKLTGTKYDFAAHSSCSTFAACMVGHRIKGEEFSIWEDLQPWKYLNSRLFGNLLLYTHTLNEAFNGSVPKRLMGIYSKLNKPIYRWIENIGDGTDGWRLLDDRYKITSFLLRMDSITQRQLNDQKRKDAKSRAEHKKKLDWESWMKGVAQLQKNLQTWREQYPRWPRLDASQPRVSEVAETRHFQDMVVAVLVATGSRPAEVYRLSEFLPVFRTESTDPERWLLHITRLAKQRFYTVEQAIQGGKGRIAPLLYFDAPTITSYVGHIRWFLKVRLAIPELSIEEIYRRGAGRSVDKIHGAVSRRVNMYFGDRVTQKELRAIWANITYDELAPNEERLMWIQRVLGHDDINTAISYATWWVEPDQPAASGDPDKIPAPSEAQIDANARDLSLATQINELQTLVKDLSNKKLTPHQQRIIDVGQRSARIGRPSPDQINQEMTDIANRLRAAGLSYGRHSFRILGFGNATISRWTKHMQNK